MNAAGRKQWFSEDKYDDNEADKQSFQCKEQSQRNAARFGTKLERPSIKTNAKRWLA